MTVKVFAHRGASGTFAEHTRAAYLQAIDDGADGVECDLHLSADGHLILLHDEFVDRTSDGSGPVAEKTLEELRALDFASWKGATIPADYGTVKQQLLTFPELMEILQSAGRPIALAIEFKYPVDGFDPALITETLTELDRCGWGASGSHAGNVDVSFMSFDPSAVAFLADFMAPKHICQLLEEPSPQGEAHLDDGDAGIAGPGVDWMPNIPEQIERWRESGRVFRVWTVNTAEQLGVCLEAGVTEVTTNWPAEIKDLIEQ